MNITIKGLQVKKNIKMVLILVDQLVNGLMESKRELKKSISKIKEAEGIIKNKITLLMINLRKKKNKNKRDFISLCKNIKRIKYNNKNNKNKFKIG